MQFGFVTLATRFFVHPSNSLPKSPRTVSRESCRLAIDLMTSAFQGGPVLKEKLDQLQTISGLLPDHAGARRPRDQ